MKRFLAVLILLSLVFAYTSCEKKKPEEKTEINLYTLNGTTGLGMAKLLDDAGKDAFETEKYHTSIETDASLVLAALTSGTADIAAVPTNAASLLYQKSHGIQVLAVNTLGCLYLLSTTEKPISSIEDLRGETVYAPAQNPTFLFSYLCEQNGLSVGTDITVDSESYAAAQNLLPMIASGRISYAVLPEPLVTNALAKAGTSGTNLTVALDLTAEWDKLPGKAGTLVQGCVVARTEFIEKHPEAVEHFLRDYEASVRFMLTDESAASLAVKFGIAADETLIRRALPNCNITYLDGEEMKNALSSYLEILYTIAPASMGNAIPNDDFY